MLTWLVARPHRQYPRSSCWQIRRPAPLSPPPQLLIDAAAPNPLNPFSPKPADSPVARALGWRRMCTQVLFFGPQDLTNPDETFEKLCEPQVICSPVVRTLVFSKVPRATIVWAEGIARDWAFDKARGARWRRF